MPKAIDLTGQKFGNWTLLERLPLINKHRFYVCQCVCGTIKTREISGIRSGASQSCGCQYHPAGKHNLTGTRTYTSWANMLQRCRNPENPTYKKYGAVGITVCDRWTNFEAFYEDMGSSGENGTLDRIDGTKGYYKENCRWATYAEQNRNRKGNKFYTFNGKTLCLPDWSKELSISEETLHSRLKIQKWTIEKAFTTPAKKYKRTNQKPA